jgi:hypothetical protein
MMGETGDPTSHDRDTTRLAHPELDGPHQPLMD